MNPKDFRSPSTGKVIQTPQGYAAFIPAPLPPLLVYDDDLVLALSRADAALSELSGLGRHLPNPHLLIPPYVPPPPEHMQEALADWQRFLHEREKLPDLIQCALMHEQFEAIHPFLDGNGRVGRLLITLFLIERGRLSQPLLYLSAYIEAYRQDYYDLLQRARTDGDWIGWLRFFITAVTETVGEAVRHARRLMDLREKFRARLRNKP